MKKIKKIIFFYLALDFILIISISFFGALQLLNSQVAMICSMAILFASFYGYKKSIENKIKSDDFEQMQEDEEEIDKKKLKFSIVGFQGAFKPYRLLAYLLLILAFFVLLKNNIFEPISFFVGLFIMPLGILLYGVFIRE